MGSNDRAGEQTKARAELSSDDPICTRLVVPT
jgi:hypothetical protein